MSHTAVQGECEAIRLLSAIVYGDAAAQARAVKSARDLLRGLTLQPGFKPCGRILTKLSPDQLLEASRMHAQGHTQATIARRLGVKWHCINHHLKPSAAMIDALVEAGRAEYLRRRAA